MWIFSRLPSLARTCHRLTFGKETETSTVTVNANGDITMWKKGRICYKRLTIFFYYTQAQVMTRYN